MPLCHAAFEHFTLVIDGAPEIVLLPVDLHENVVEVPAPIAERTHRLNAVPPDPSRENRPETVPPEPHRLVRDVDPALVQQVLDVSLGQRVADIQHDRQADDIGRRLEGAEDARAAHAWKAIGSRPGHKPIFL